MKFKNKRTGIIENVSLPELFQQYLDRPGIWERIDNQQVIDENQLITKKIKKGK